MFARVKVRDGDGTFSKRNLENKNVQPHASASIEDRGRAEK
jgi:hypothetical protein